MKKKPIPLLLVVAVLLLSGLLLVACDSSEPTPVEVTREVEVEVTREVEVEVEATREVEVEVTRVVEVEVEAPAAPQSEASGLACSDIDSEALGLDNVEITSAEVVANDGLYPAYCLVGGTANERTGIDEKSYAIGFELRLPVAWNGRFLYQANGGNDGAVVPAEGNNSTPNSAGDVSALRRGFAVLSTDAGHNGSDPANAELGLVNGNVFGLDPQARADYGYASVGTMTPIAKQIVAAHYGTEPAYSYMYGCSNGGRHGMVAASRYAEQFDGILAGNPGFNLPKAAVQHAWDVQSFQIANPDIREAFSPEDMNLIAAGVVAACDAQDGAEDGIVADLRVCQETFNLADLQCTGEKNESCLTADQVTALERSMGGPINSEGEQLYSEWAYDGGMGSGNWRFWKLESQIPPWDFYPLIATLGGGSLSYIFTTPPTETPGTPADLVDFLTNFDFDTDAPKIFATDETFTESPQEFMTPPDVDDPTLSALQAAGGKLLVYHGASDGVFSVVDTINWYEELADNNEGDASDFARLFVVPGMNHCSGGPATDQFDALTALINWVESEQAPEQIIATVDPTNAELPESWSPSRSRPLCPWPQIAKLKEGETEEVDLESADSFECESQISTEAGAGSQQPAVPADIDLQALDRTEFMVLYPDVLTDHEQELVSDYFALNESINTRGDIDTDALVAGTLPPDTPGLGPVLEVTEELVNYQSNRIDPRNPIWRDLAVATAAGYEGLPAYPTFGAHDDSVMTPWPPPVRDRLLVSDLNHSVTNYLPVYAGDTLYTVLNNREVVDLTPAEGSTRRAVALISQASIYNQNGDKVSDVIFRVTEQLSIYADRADAPENPGFFDVWEAPDWLARPEHLYTDEDWAFILDTWKAEEIRGAEPRFWEDVAIGDQPIPTLDGPIEQGPTPTWGLGMGLGGSQTLFDVALSEDGLADLIRNPTDGIYRMEDPNDQIPEAPPAPAFDNAPPPPPPAGAIDVATIHTSEVQRGPLVNFLGRDLAIRHVTNWMGDTGWLKTISWSIMDPRSHWESGLPAVPNPYAVRYVQRVPGMEDAYVSIHGVTKDVAYVQSVVTDKRIVDDAYEVELIWWIETIDGQIWEEGMAVVQLPSRDAGIDSAVPAAQ